MKDATGTTQERLFLHSCFTKVRSTPFTKHNALTVVNVFNAQRQFPRSVVNGQHFFRVSCGNKFARSTHDPSFISIQQVRSIVTLTSVFKFDNVTLKFAHRWLFASPYKNQGRLYVFFVLVVHEQISQHGFTLLFWVS